MTTIITVRKDGKVVMAGDGQVSLGQTVMKGNARKVRRIGKGGEVIAGFAGATADAFTLLDRLEKKLEQYPGQLMRAVVVQHMQRDPGVLGESLEEFAHQFGVEGADLRRAEINVPDEERPTGDVDGRLGHRLVHGKVDRGIARNALAVAQRLGNRLAERDARILDGMVIVDMQVALHLDVHVDQRVTAELVEHMVEEAHARRNLARAGAVDMDGNRDRGFVGLAGNFAFTLCHLAAP